MKSIEPGTRILMGRFAVVLAGIVLLFCSGCNRTNLQDESPLTAQYEPPPQPAEPYQSNALVQEESSPSSVDWMGYEGEGANETSTSERHPTAINSPVNEESEILSEPLRPLEPPQQIAQVEFPSLPEYEDLYGEVSSPAPDSRAPPSTIAPTLTQSAAQDLARFVFDAVEGRDRTTFLQVVSSMDAETVWGKVTRVKGEWEVDARTTGPTEMAVSTRFYAQGADGVFEKTYHWRVQWQGEWKVVEWKR